MVTRAFVVCLSVSLTACAAPALPPPDLPTLAVPGRADFPVAARPDCNPDVVGAVEAGNVAALQQLAAAYEEFSCRSRYGQPPLDIAVINDHPEVVRALLEGGADANLRWAGSGDRFPLQEAVMLRGHYRQTQLHRAEIVSLLIAHGADVNARFCLFESRQSIGREKGCTAATSETPLMMAAQFDQPEVVSLLLEAGAEPKVERRDRGTALDMAASESVYGLIAMKGFGAEAAAVADFVERKPGSFTPTGQGPLVDAVSGGAYGTARLTLRAAPPATADLTAALAAATIRNATAMVELLMAHGADARAGSCPSNLYLSPRGIDMSGCTPDRGATPLMLAAAFGASRVRWMLTGVDGVESQRDWRGRNARDYARLAGHEGLFPRGAPVR